MKRYAILTALLLGAGVGCNNQTPVAGDNETPKPAPAVADTKALDPYVMAEKPAQVISIRDAMTKSDGEKVVVTGQTPPVNVKPYNAAVAAFILMAPEDLNREDVKEELSCEEAATCPMCKKLLDKYGVQVEIVDKSGAPLATTVEGFRGLKPGSAITVEGTVQRHGKDKKLVKIVATKFYPG
jgi:hypothetical protein